MINEFGIRAYHIYAWIINESVQEEPPWCVTVGEIEDVGQSRVGVFQVFQVFLRVATTQIQQKEISVRERKVEDD
ncbi:hypothetical protein YC2023_082840 [Brassica napus]